MTAAPLAPVLAKLIASVEKTTQVNVAIDTETAIAIVRWALEHRPRTRNLTELFRAVLLTGWDALNGDAPPAPRRDETTTVSPDAPLTVVVRQLLTQHAEAIAASALDEVRRLVGGLLVAGDVAPKSDKPRK